MKGLPPTDPLASCLASSLANLSLCFFVKWRCEDLVVSPVYSLQVGA